MVPSPRSLRGHPQGAVQPDDLAVEHPVLHDVQGERGELSGIAQPGGERDLCAERCLDIVESVGSPALRLAWDSANFVQVGVARPFDDGYRMLRPHLEYLQVKDALSETGEVSSPHGTWECRACLRAFSLKMLGLVRPPSFTPGATT